jgi:hypothetical protein
MADALPASPSGPPGGFRKPATTKDWLSLLWQWAPSRQTSATAVLIGIAITMINDLRERDKQVQGRFDELVKLHTGEMDRQRLLLDRNRATFAKVIEEQQTRATEDRRQYDRRETKRDAIITDLSHAVERTGQSLDRLADRLGMKKGGDGGEADEHSRRVQIPIFGVWPVSVPRTMPELAPAPRKISRG